MVRVKRSLRSLDDRRRARLDQAREPADADWYALMERLQAADRAASERRIAAAASALNQLR